MEPGPRSPVAVSPVPSRPDLQANAGTVEVPVTVCMERKRLAHRFLGEQWRAAAACTGNMSTDPVVDAGMDDAWAAMPADAPSAVDPQPEDAGSPGVSRWWVPGLSLRLSRDEVLGYAQNLVAPEPRLFVLWRMRDDRAVPALLSASYDAGLRMFDSGERVDAVPLPPAIAAVMRDFVECHRDRLERDMQGERRRRVD